MELIKPCQGSQGLFSRLTVAFHAFLRGIKALGRCKALLIALAEKGGDKGCDIGGGRSQPAHERLQRRKHCLVDWHKSNLEICFYLGQRIGESLIGFECRANVIYQAPDYFIENRKNKHLAQHPGESALDGSGKAAESLFCFADLLACGIYLPAGFLGGLAGLGGGCFELLYFPSQLVRASPIPQHPPFGL